MSKVVFVGNVPYNMGEEQLIEIFRNVGQVVGFRLVYDRETGKPKGYGFCEFADHETAASAVRNLNNTDCGGRPLRIDLADSDPFLEGKTTVHGEIIDSSETRAQWRQRERRDNLHDDRGASRNDPSAFLKNLPPGVSLLPGTKATDAISQILATMDPSQLTEVLAQMKAFVINHPEQARALLVANPQFAYALFQALLLNKIVDPAILQRMLNATSANTPQTPVPPHVQTPPHGMSQPTSVPGQYPVYSQPPSNIPPPAAAMQQQQQTYYHQAPAAQQPTQTHVPAAPPATPQINLPASMDPQQRAMLQHVLALTSEQINTLPPNERDAINVLRSQFLGAAAATGQT